MCVPPTSEHPEEVLKLLDKIRSDSRYYDLPVCGIEGKDYELTEKGYVTMLSDFDSEAGIWGMATTQVKRLYDGIPAAYETTLADLTSRYETNVI